MQPATPRPVLVVDFGAQYAQLIARRVREARVYSEVIPHTATVEDIKAKDPRRSCCPAVRRACTPRALRSWTPRCSTSDAGVRICYGFQAMAQALGGTVARTGTSEYGRTELKVTGGQLHSDLPAPSRCG